MERRNFLATAFLAVGLLPGCTFGSGKPFDAKIENNDESAHSLDIEVIHNRTIWEKRFQLSAGEDQHVQDAFSMGVDNTFFFRVECILDDSSTHWSMYSSRDDVIKIRIVEDEMMEFPNGFRRGPTPEGTPTPTPKYHDTPHE